MRTHHKILILGVFGCLALCIALPLISTVLDLLPPTRASYQTIDRSSVRWQTNFEQSYQRALVAHEPWVQDSSTLALRAAGYPNLDRTKPERVSVAYAEPSQVVIVVTSEILMDDSVQQKETRVELRKQDTDWQIDWVGQRWKCYRNLLPGWTSSYCS